MRLQAWIWMLCAGLAACGGQPQSPAPASAPAATAESASGPEESGETAEADVDADVDAAPAPEPEPELKAEPEPEPETQAAPDLHATPQAEIDQAVLQAEAILQADDEVQLHRLLQHLLQARNQAPEDPSRSALVERVASRLMDWGELALAHGNSRLLQRDLPLLQQLNLAQPRVQALAAELERVQRIAAQLQKAEQQRAAGKHLAPPGDNAVESLHEVLKQVPEHRIAARHLAQIEASVLDQALQAADQNHFAQADALLAQAGRIRGFSAQVQDAAARLVELRERRLSEVRAQVKGALDAGDVGAAQKLLPELEAVAPSRDEAGQLQAQIERVQRYGVHDAGALLLDPLADGGQGPGMVVLPVGHFMMGSANSDSGRHASELPQHRVQFTRGFAMSRTEITVGQFRAFIESSGHRSQTRGNRKAPVYDERRGSIIERQGVTWRDDYAGKPAPDELPVVHVSWEDAAAYAQWLSEQTGARYRLPSEAEFEYALRAGSSGVFPWPGQVPPANSENLTGALDASPSGRSWSNAFEGYGDGYWGPAPVGRFASNAFGLADINGNVSEWVADCWHDSYARAPRDGSAWVNPGCQQRVVRGGSWASSPDRSRSAFRLPAAPTHTSPRVGFRVVREL